MRTRLYKRRDKLKLKPKLTTITTAKLIYALMIPNIIHPLSHKPFFVHNRSFTDLLSILKRLRHSLSDRARNGDAGAADHAAVVPSTSISVRSPRFSSALHLAPGIIITARKERCGIAIILCCSRRTAVSGGVR